MSTLVQIQGATKQFGGVTAVNDVTTSIEQGKIFSIIGPNGAGKTTLFNLITGAYTLSSGSIRFGETEIGGMKVHEINKLGIARTFQNIRLFDKLTVLENVMVGYHSRITAPIGLAFVPGKTKAIEGEILDKAMHCLERVGLADKYAEMATSLPYGQQRRLEIARALVSDPGLLLLDEPAAGMNNKESADLLELIQRINKEMHKTILFIEHNMKVVMTISERIMVLDHGVKIAEGDPEMIKNDPAVIEAYLGKSTDDKAAGKEGA